MSSCAYPEPQRVSLACCCCCCPYCCLADDHFAAAGPGQQCWVVLAVLLACKGGSEHAGIAVDEHATLACDVFYASTDEVPAAAADASAEDALA
jgi:hypothetical protein